MFDVPIVNFVTTQRPRKSRTGHVVCNNEQHGRKIRQRRTGTPKVPARLLIYISEVRGKCTRSSQVSSLGETIRGTSEFPITMKFIASRYKSWRAPICHRSTSGQTARKVWSFSGQMATAISVQRSSRCSFTSTARTLFDFTTKCAKIYVSSDSRRAHIIRLDPVFSRNRARKW